MFACVPVSLYYDERSFSGILSAALITAFVGVSIFLTTRKTKKNVGKREGYLIVGLGWLIMIVFGTLPYLFTFSQLSPHLQEVNPLGITNAFFESMSGFTTTGASILSDIEIMPKGLLFWRSLTHWIGGMGIIVLTIAILPLLGIGGMQLFVAEAPGVSTDKLHPRITDTAKRLWIIYVVFTILELFLLKFAGMGWFDAGNHALSNIATGGFSTRNASVGYWNGAPLVQYIIIFFMFLGGTNFVLNYYLLKGAFSKFSTNKEFRVYTLLILFVSAVCTALLISSDTYAFEEAFRHSLFSVIAIVTTTGFVTADFTQWMPFLTVIFFFLMFVGGSSGSTSGGVKVARHIILIRNSVNELKRLVHPKAIVPMHYNNKPIPEGVVYNVLAFLIIYIMIFIVGTIIMAFLDSGMTPNYEDFVSALGATASSLGNVGPTIGAYSPVHTFAHMNDAAKWFASFLMLLGRLELFTILILFTPWFWKK